MTNEEMLPLVDEEGRTIGSATRSRCHGGEKLLHPVVHLHIFNSEGKLLLQHRSMIKKIQPGKWDTAVGGHVSRGESVETALRREAFEETGINDFTPTLLARYVFESKVERELVNSFTTTVVSGFTPYCEEPDIDELRFFTPTEIEAMIERGETTPNFAQEYKTYLRNKDE